MSLTKDDLNQIEQIVDKVVTAKVTHAVSGLATKDELTNAVSGLVTKVEFTESLDRMEGRLTTAINLLQRDTFARLDQHEARISRLEQSTSP